MANRDKLGHQPKSAPKIGSIQMPESGSGIKDPKAPAGEPSLVLERDGTPKDTPVLTSPITRFPIDPGPLAPARLDGQAAARHFLLELLKREADRAELYGSNEEFVGGFRDAILDAVKLIETTEPLEIWEIDARSGYMQWSTERTARGTRASLNGERLEMCMAADSVRGIALVSTKDAAGHVVTSNGSILLSLVRGDITFEPAA